MKQEALKLLRADRASWRLFCFKPEWALLGLYIGIMEKKRETTVFILELYRGYIGYIWGIYWDNGNENVNYGDLGGYIGVK